MPKYDVCYSVGRTEWYRIEAENPQDARDRAFEEGEELDNSGDTHEVNDVDCVEVEDPTITTGETHA